MLVHRHEQFKIAPRAMSSALYPFPLPSLSTGRSNLRTTGSRHPHVRQASVAASKSNVGAFPWIRKGNPVSSIKSEVLGILGLTFFLLYCYTGHFDTC